jgi:pimeloyl-ACP methyl ester carboxylesterase
MGPDDRLFNVVVVNWRGKPLSGAIVHVLRDGKAKMQLNIENGPKPVTMNGPGEIKLQAFYKNQTKTHVLQPDETLVRIRMVTRSAMAWLLGLCVVAFTAVWLLNAGIFPVGDPNLTTQSDYTGPGPHNKPAVIVFVHGVFGGADTWQNQKSSFPDLLATDPDFGGKLDAFTFDYYSPRFGHASTITGLASKLRLALNSHRVFQDHQQVAFLVHSMGGLVVRQFLIQSRDLSKVKMVYFSASPTNGADIAAIGRALFWNPQLRGMLSVQSNDFLQAIQSDWRNWPEAMALPSYCAYEEMPTYGIIVVPFASATAFCNRDLDPISANHVDIVKPPSRNDPRYQGVKTALLANLSLE